MTDGKSCVEDLNRILRKYALDKYQNTPIENLDDDRLIWHAVSDLPHLNLKSSMSWRIFVFRIQPEKEVTLRQICRRGANYVLIQGSTIKTLTFDHVVIGFVIPPGISFQQLFSHGDKVDVIGCCRITTPEQTNSFAAPIFNFPLWNVAEPHKNGRGDRHTPHGNPSDDAHLQQPFIPGSDDDDAFSFGDAMLVDEGIVDNC